MQKQIKIIKAKENNLKNINVCIPHYSLTVITGLSGSGKSTLAYDVIYNEGQRRYLETFSAYARNYIGTFKKPNVEKIEGLTPVIAINQKSAIYNPRSTVGTLTEIYDYLRLLYARISEAYSYITGKKMEKFTEEQIINLIFENYANQKIEIFAPLVIGRKGTYENIFEEARKKGFLKIRIDNVLYDVNESPKPKLDRYKQHYIDVLIDELIVSEKNFNRLKRSISLGLKYGNSTILIINEKQESKYLSKNYICADTGLSYKTPAPFNFSFNSPNGWCSLCKGLGFITNISSEKIIKNKNLSIIDGGIPVLLNKKFSNLYFLSINILKKNSINPNTPIKDLPQHIINELLYGTKKDDTTSSSLELPQYFDSFYTYDLYNLPIKKWLGIINHLALLYNNNYYEYSEELEEYTENIICPECNGLRLNKEALHFKINEKNIAELSLLELNDLYNWFLSTINTLSQKHLLISYEIIKEILEKIEFIKEIGLGYLNLYRNVHTLSGGELQRLRLATQITTNLINITYILDEPSIGLHPSDAEKLINALNSLKKKKNTIIVIEHDKRIIENADYIIDLGLYGGDKGGYLIACGALEDIKKSKISITGQYLRNEKIIDVPLLRRKKTDKKLILYGANGNNLKNITVEIPIGLFVVVVGVSGSGKSSLITDTLYPAIKNKIHKTQLKCLNYSKIEGYENITKVYLVDQKPIGRTSRSNIATYLDIFTEIRKLFASTPIAKVRGYTQSRFSFNLKGGRCEICKGMGIKTIQMKYLPDVYVVCPECNGKRFNESTLEVTYKNKNINDILEMTVSEAKYFFENIKSLNKAFSLAEEIGLGYLKLGQPTSTLSGGEAQRLKLIYELLNNNPKNCLYIFDEPTTGLHFENINSLIKIFHKLVEQENTIIVIEHNIDIIKQADWIIELGPGSGKDGGEIIFSGTPEDIIIDKKSNTGFFLRNELSLN